MHSVELFGIKKIFDSIQLFLRLKVIFITVEIEDDVAHVIYIFNETLKWNCFYSGYIQYINSKSDRILSQFSIYLHCFE